MGQQLPARNTVLKAMIGNSETLANTSIDDLKEAANALEKKLDHFNQVNRNASSPVVAMVTPTTVSGIDKQAALRSVAQLEQELKVQLQKNPRHQPESPKPSDDPQQKQGPRP
jgi:hypothetical protein